MKRILTIVSTMVFIVGVLNCQVFDDFNDGDFLSNPQWHGDIQDFIINTKYRLQLDAPEGGNSRLFVRYGAVDSMEWSIYVNLDFNPSNSNKLKIFLMIDNPNLDSTSGFFCEIGENGNDDNLKFYEINKGEKKLIAEGEPGLFASSFETELKISKKSSGFWSFQTKGENQYFKEDFEVFNDKFSFDSAYFMLDLYYTKTRKDKFVFDDIYIRPFEHDTKAPMLEEAILLDKTHLLLTFDEELDKTSVYQFDNYTVEKINIHPVNIFFDENTPNKVLLVYPNEFESGIDYKILVQGIKDLKGNKIKSQSTFFFLIESPGQGDIAINEILFNPNKDARDFIELVNISNKYIDIKGVKIMNTAKEGKGTVIVDNLILRTGDYLCISSDTNSVINNYFVPDSAVLFQNKMPSFDDNGGNVSLYITKNNVEIMIDSFEYSEEMHSSFIADNEGLSLERKNPNLETNDRFNWTSCSTIAGGATPGYKNSVYYKTTFKNKEPISIKNKVFSPDNDGNDDELIIEYNLDEPENYAEFYIFDPKGRLVTQLVNNETLGKNGLVVWDGYCEKTRVPVGIYLLYYKIVDINSNVIEGKKTIVLAEYLK